MTRCYRCSYTGPNLLCTECEVGAYMKADQTTCVSRLK